MACQTLPGEGFLSVRAGVKLMLADDMTKVKPRLFETDRCRVQLLTNNATVFNRLLPPIILQVKYTDLLSFDSVAGS